MRMILTAGAVLSTLALAAPVSAAPKPSFACAKAKLAVEKRICGDANMAASDAAIARNYANLRTILDPRSWKALVEDQRWFIAVRNGAMEPNPMLKTQADKVEWLRALLSERASFLAAIRPRTSDDLSGEWGNFAGAFEILKGTDGALRVSANAVDPVAARWVCEFDGTGEAKKGPGQITIAKSIEAGPDEPGLGLTRTGAMLHVQELHSSGDETSTYCGMNGGLGGNYFPVRH